MERRVGVSRPSVPLMHTHITEMVTYLNCTLLLLGLQDEVQNSNADDAKCNGTGTSTSRLCVRVVVFAEALELGRVNATIITSHG